MDIHVIKQKAWIYGIYLIISAIVAGVIFWLIPSQASVEGSWEGYAFKAGGGLAGFLITFAALVYAFQRDTFRGNLKITGNVFDEEQTPITGAMVFVDGIDRRKTTDETGWFTLEVEPRAEWTVRASKDSYSSASTTVKTTDTPVTLVLKKKS